MIETKIKYLTESNLGKKIQFNAKNKESSSEKDTLHITGLIGALIRDSEQEPGSLNIVLTTGMSFYFSAKEVENKIIYITEGKRY